ncbi:TraM recognition domain-containing protein [Cloacibacillus porcorum]
MFNLLCERADNVFGGRESYTIKEISENWLGKATISMQTEGRTRGQSESYNQNTQRLGRELMTPVNFPPCRGTSVFCSSGACRRSFPPSTT